MEKEIKIYSYDREKGSTEIDTSKTLKDLREQLKEEEELKYIQYSFLDSKKKKINEKKENKYIINSCLIEGNKINIKDSLQINLEGKLYNIDIDKNKELNLLRNDISNEKEIVKSINGMNYGFLTLEKNVVKEEEENTIKIKDIMYFDEDTLMDIIYIKILILLQIKIDEKIIIMNLPKGEKLSKIRNLNKKIPENYCFINNDKIEIERDSESKLSIEKIISKDNYIYMKKMDSAEIIEEKESKKELKKKIEVDETKNTEKENFYEEEELSKEKENEEILEILEKVNLDEEESNLEEKEKKLKEAEDKKIIKEKENGIYFNLEKNRSNYLNIEIKTDLEPLEIYNLEDETQKGYKFVKMEKIDNNQYLYFALCPIYDNIDKVIFGIRKCETKDPVYINNEHLPYDKKNKSYELLIEKEKRKDKIFDIFNEPRLTEKNILLYLQRIHEIEVGYELEFSYIRKATNKIKYSEIIDKILEIGINHKLTYKLIIILVEKDINIIEASKYLNLNENKYQMNEKIEPNNFHKTSAYIIKKLNELSENKKSEEPNSELDNDDSSKNEWILCCRKNIPKSIEPIKFENNIIEELKNNLLKDFSEDELNCYKNRILEKMKLIDENKLDKIIITDKTKETLMKIYKLELGVISNIPIIIQGFTSAGKSYLSKFVLNLNKRKYDTVVLSEYTTQEDLLGRDSIDKKYNSVNFSPGILLNAYIEGKTVILDECDLAKPEILSCIIGTITKDELTIRNKTYWKNENYNVILTMNGESKGFNEKQRNILTSNILSKFIIIYFEEIDKKESEEIFERQLEKSENYKNKSQEDKNIIKSTFIEIHERMMKKKHETIDPIVTLRNLKNYIYFDRGQISPRIAGEISYTARFPKEERKSFEDLLNKLGKFEIDEGKKKLILEYIDKENLVYDEDHKNIILRVIYLALIACEGGFHPLLIGKEGSGLTKLAKIIASIYSKGNYEFLLCNSETSDEDLIGNYLPETSKKSQNLSSLIHWKDGTVLKALKEGKPVILDDINYSKAQIIESLNSLLELNIKYTNNYKYIILQKSEDKEISINEKNKNFIIIGTMKYENSTNISKALMNRFVAIYLDEIIISQDNADLIITKTIENINEKEKIKFKSILANDGFKGNLKSIIKQLKNLNFLYNEIEKYHFTLEDCNNLLNLNFNNFKYKKEDIEFLLTTKIKDLKDSQNNNSFFFFDKNDINYSENNEALKMIIGIIISDFLNRPIFIQGCPGSGKSCAARFYGANRNKNIRDPILSINCHRDLLFDSLIGNYSFHDDKFEFVDGPLLTAIKNGEVILLDEFNLCSENILANLYPILKADYGEKIKIKGVPDPIEIKEGFLIIATGNFQNEKGRRKIPNYILNEIKILEVKSSELNYNALDKLMKAKYKDIILIDEAKESEKKSLISIKQIKEICDFLSYRIQEQFSMRQIKCLLERIKRFKNEEIPVIYIIICYLIPQFYIEKEVIESLLEELNEIMKYNNLEELKQFLCSEVKIFENEKEKGNYIKKGIICLSTSLDKEELPQACLQTYFWIRMSCNYSNDTLSENENLLLIGNTSYKEYILNKWLKSKIKDENYETYYLSKNTAVQDLIGISSLDDENNLENVNKQLLKESETSFKIDLSKFQDSCIKNENKDCIVFIHECYEKIKLLCNNLKNKLNLKTTTSFHLGIITLSYIFGKTLILKGIENPQPSVIERLNSILEIPRNLVLTEDNQNLFNNKEIFSKVYNNSNKTSIPLNKNFHLIFTSRNAFNKSFSKAFLSRCTVIQCPSYKDKNYLTIKFDIEKNYLDISKNILSENNLENEIINLKKELNREIEILSFIRWCKTTRNLYDSIKKYIDVYLNEKSALCSDKKINYKYIVGISALRSIIDKYDLEERKNIVRQYFYYYLPKKLYSVILNELSESNIEIPFVEIEHNNEKYIKSIYSEIILKVNKVNKNYLDNIIWTNSSIDISDALLVSLIANTILVLEGPPGRGKTAISKCIFDYLNIKTRRLNFSPSTTKEDIFSRITPKTGKDKILTENENKDLLIILEESKNKNEYYEHGLILDEINLSKDELLEDLYSYLISIKSQEKKKYTTPEGKQFSEYGNIGVVVTMNGSNMSNSRTSLSSSFLQLCHSFKLSDYTEEEKVLLMGKILNKYIGKNDIIKINKKISKNKNYTFREIIKLSNIFEKINNIENRKKIDLILEPEKSLNLNDSKLKMDNKYLYFGDYVKYPLNKSHNQELIKQFTYSQKEALIRIMIGLNIEKTILLTGDIGTGKTFIIEELAKLTGSNLKIIQFNYETTSNDLIGRLELNKKNLDDLKEKLNEMEKLLINKEYEFVTKFIELNNSMEVSKITDFLKKKNIDLKNLQKIIN